MTTTISSRPSPTLLTCVVAAVVGALVPVTAAHAATPMCHGVRATIVGTSGADTLQGTGGRDVIVGRGGNDTIHGGGGADLICGGRGADHLYGDSGADRLIGGRDRVHNTEDGTERIGDTLRGGRGDDRMYAGADDRPAENIAYDSIRWDDATRGVTIDLATRTATGEGADRFSGGEFAVVGSSYSDVVTGSDGADRIYTGPGSDLVRAHGGADVVVVDDVHRGHGGYADRVWGGDGADRISAGRGPDRLSGGRGADSLEDMGNSNDVLLGGPGDDDLVGEIGDADEPQRFAGGAGFDTLDLYSDGINRRMNNDSTGSWDMATGAMTFTLGQTTVSLTAAGIERAIFGSWGTTWTVRGTPEADIFSGAGTSASTFDGLAGDDTFRGSDGDDVFNGGAGEDRALLMGDGDDTCISVETLDTDDCEHVS